MKALSIQIIPAQSGFFTVVDLSEEKDVIIDEPVIAWRIETYPIKSSDDTFSTCVPITLNGDAVSNCIGVQNPDKSITVFEESTYPSLAELMATRYPV